MTYNDIYMNCVDSDATICNIHLIHSESCLLINGFVVLFANNVNLQFDN